MHFPRSPVRSRQAKRRPGRPRKDPGQLNNLDESTYETEQSYNPRRPSLLTHNHNLGRQFLLPSHSPMQIEPVELIMTNCVRVKQEMLDSSPEEGTVEQVLDLRKSNKEKSCTWCGKTGDFQEKGAHKDFCSDICFDQYRRDSFKKRSACIWCSSTSAQQFILSSANVDESKFCSPQCLAQFKVRVFCEETSAHLDQLKDVNLPEGIKDLITPELWLQNSSNGSGKRSASTLSGTSDSLYTSTAMGGHAAGSVLTALSRPSPSLSSSSAGTGPTIGPRTIMISQGALAGTSSSPSYGSPGGLGSTQTTTSTIGGAPLRKRGRTVAKSSTTVISQQRSPNENLSIRTGNPTGSNALHSPILNFSTALREKQSRFNARRSGVSSSSNSSSSRMSMSASHQNPMISPFPGINSPIMNKTFPLTGFPFSSHFPYPNSRFSMEPGAMTSTRPEVVNEGAVSNSSLLSPSTIPIPTAAVDRGQNHHSPGYTDSQPERTERSYKSQKGASLAGLFSSHGFISNSYPPITMIVPIPLPVPIPIPIPIPIIFNSSMSSSLNSKKSENASNKGGIDLLISCSDNNNTDTSNANTTKNNNTNNRDSSDNGRCDKLKIRGQIIDVDEND